MSLGVLAARLYTIQSKKNVPLRTAAMSMIKESLAVRFSVYSMVKALTKSELLATIAESKYGFRTPQEKQQQKDQERREQQRTEEDLKFRNFTVNSMLALNRKMDMLTEIATRNREMINTLYNDLGYFKNQRRFNPNNVVIKSIRVPLRSKTVKGQIEKINADLAALRAITVGAEEGYKFIRKEKIKKEKQEKDKSFIESIVGNMLTGLGITGLLKKLTPLLKFIPRVGMGSAVSLGALAITLPTAIQNSRKRMQGELPYEDPMQEGLSRIIDTASLVGGTYMAGKGAYMLGSAIRNKWKSSKMGKESERNARIRRINKYTEQFKTEGYAHREAQKMAGEKAKQVGSLGKRLQKMKFINRAVSGIAKRFPAVVAAEVAYRLSQMIALEADYGSKKIPYTEYKTGMVNNYSEIISSVGLTAFGTITGSLAGTGLFPGLGTGLGAIAGMGAGGLMSLFVDEQSPTMLWVAGKVFELLHENKEIKKSTTQSAPSEERPPSGRGSRSADGIAAGGTRRQGIRGGGGAGVRSILPENVQAAKPITTSSGRALLDFIGSLEASPPGNYNSIYGGASVNLTDMTIAQVFDLQRSMIERGRGGATSSAVGKYQFIHNTLKEEVQAAGLNPETTKFTPEIQDKLIMNRLTRVRGYRKFGNDEISAQTFAENLSMEFASLPSPIKGGGVESYYQGDAVGNKALTTIDKVYAILGVRSGENPTLARTRSRARASDTMVAAAPRSEPAAASVPELPAGQTVVETPPSVAQVSEEEAVTEEVLSAQVSSQAALVAFSTMQQQLNAVNSELIKIQRTITGQSDNILTTDPSFA